MTHQELNIALAKAIGWRKDQIVVYEGQDYIGLPWQYVLPCVRIFDYRHWCDIGPIAERYDLFPVQELKGWIVFTRLGCSPTPQEAIARAVIKRKAT